MDSSTSHSTEEIRLQQLVERVQQGDDRARSELIAHTYDRLRRLTRTILHQDFQRLADRHDLTSIVDQGVLKLLDALKGVQPPTVADYFRFAAALIRRVLLDLARKTKPGQPASPDDTPDTASDPALLAVWTEFHEAVERLPDDERSVFDLHFYQGLTQEAVSRILSIHPKQVSRLWLRATRRLPTVPA